MSARSEITLRYFAWVREKTGHAEERVTLPSGVVTVADLLAWLQSRGPGFEDAFSKPGVIRTAIDKRHVKAETPIAGAQEIAFFPPVTGG
jgi:molybdopterin synthase sulfur carrier subunit